MLMRRLDELPLDYAFVGSRMLPGMHCREGHGVNRKGIQWLMYLSAISP
jgi:hypothetical protein